MRFAPEGRCRFSAGCPLPYRQLSVEGGDLLSLPRQQAGTVHRSGHPFISRPITLQQRWALRPLLSLLHSRGIAYRWRFLFSLSATNAGRNTLLKMPEDIQRFCKILCIPTVDLGPCPGGAHYTNFFTFSPNLSCLLRRQSICRRASSLREASAASSPQRHNARSTRRA